MFAKTSFKKSALSLSVSAVLPRNTSQKGVCLSLFLSVLCPQTFANETVLESAANLPTTFSVETATSAETNVDSIAMLQALQNQPIAAEFDVLKFEDLEHLAMPTINQEMADEIARLAEEAKLEAQAQANRTTDTIVVNDATVLELAEINSAPVQVDELMQRIEQNAQIAVDQTQASSDSASPWATPDQMSDEAQPGFIGRLWQRVRPRQQMQAKVARITADVNIANANNTGNVRNSEYEDALENLKTNIRGKLSTFTQESFADYNVAVPQLRALARQAANAVGFYQAEFRFEAVNARQVRVFVEPNEAVVVRSQNIEFSGAGEKHPRFQIIKVLPELEEGDVFHHGLYQTTKQKIETAASDNGFFDSYWRLHDVKIAQPENTADINLRFETGDRYRLSQPIFRMSKPDTPFPLRPEILKQLVPWEDEVDFTAWRVNALANNLANSRYFNYTLVDAIRPDPVERKTEVPPDIQELLDEYQLSYEDLQPTKKKVTPLTTEQAVAQQNQVNESEFVGTDEETESDLAQLQKEHDARRVEQEGLKQQARLDKNVPVIVTLNADKLNSAEIGAGFGTDTGPRIRAQYRRAIVNDRGHSFDANMEVSQIRQAIDGRYNIPYKHPLNDYIAVVGGYEREERDDVAQGSGMLIESAILGADRVIKNPRGNWQHNYGVRYRLDRLELDGNVDPEEIPPAFVGGGSDEQQSLLFGYEISRTDTDRRINPTQGLKQTYKVEVGSENLFTDTNMVIVNAQWRALYSLGAQADHQLVGRTDLGYIFSDDFNRVPYNLRYFSGGDQSIRGFDYKSLSPEVDGYKIGGQALAIGSMEYNYQFKPGWRAAVFSDFGNAYNEDFSNGVEYGVGLGIRWESPIGPVRIDVASGISDPGKPIRVHFFIGSQL